MEEVAIRLAITVNKSAPHIPKRKGKFVNPYNSSELCARILCLLASVLGMSAKKEVAKTLGIRTRSWDRWISGYNRPTRPVLYKAIGLLTNTPLGREGELSLPQQWRRILARLAEIGGTTPKQIAFLLDLKGEMDNDQPSTVAIWRVLEMAIWLKTGVRIQNFRRLDWQARIATLRATARAEVIICPFVGWFDALQPFALAGRPAQITGAQRILMQARETGDVEAPRGGRRRRNR